MNQKKISILITSLLIASVLFAVPAVMAADARVYISAVSPAKSGYAVDETVIVNAKIKWEDLPANKTLSIQLWNSTDKLETLESYVVPVQDNSTGTPVDYTTTNKGPDGSYSPSYTPSADLTEEVGTSTYYLKVVGTDGLTIDSEPFVILVAIDSITLSITWEDQNNDRTVDVNEGVVFTAYINWDFIETTEAHSLYVDWGTGTEELLSTVSITAGSGSDTDVNTKGFNTAGTKAVIFKLKDSTGTVVKTLTVNVNVGAAATTTTTPAAAEQSSLVAMIGGNWQIIIIVICVVGVGAYLVKGEDGGKKKKGR